MNRRKFLAASAALGALWKVPAFAQRQEGQAEVPSLPPPIAALKSMKDQARPVTAEERRARVEKARGLMAKAKIDALVLTPGTSLVYFTNIRWSGGERLFACVLPRKGEPFFVCPAFEEDRAREQIATGPFGGKADVRTWEEDESPFGLLARGLADRGVRTGSIGMEETAKYVFASGIAGAAPQAHVVSGTPVTAGCRMVKDGHELELMQLASSVTLAAYKAAYESMLPGMTQNAASDLISLAHRRLGFPGGASVQTGEYSALPHGSTKVQTIGEGTVVMIDGGCSVEGYSSDITRTFVLGTASDKAKAVFGIVRRAQDAALKAARPGVTLDSIDAAAREVITSAGYGPGFKYFTHRVGHGLGMDGHEWPYLVKNNMFGWKKSLQAQAGMTFSDEPGIYIRGEFGVRLEDDMLITADGAKLFTPQSDSIEKPF